MRKAGPVWAVACLCACLPAFAWPLRALAESPRDAIRNLPTLTYTNYFTTTNPADPGQDFTDALDSRLDIGWNSPTVALKSGISTWSSLNAHLWATDNLNRVAKYSTDSRSESFDYTVNLSKPGMFSSNYIFSRGDRWNGSTGNPDPRDDSANTKSFNFTLTLPNYPSLQYHTFVTDTYPPVPKLAETGSSVEWSQYILHWEKQGGAVYSSYNMDLQSKQSTTFNEGQPRGDSGENYSAFDAVRQMPLGQIGNLQLSCHYDEDSSSNIARTGADVSRRSMYQLNLDGAVARLPLSYSAWYANSNTSSALSSSNTIDRFLGLTYLPPVAAGKLAKVQLNQHLVESEYPNSHTALQTQDLILSLNPNPHTQSSISYNNTQTTDVLHETMTQDDEKLTLWMHYNVPGDRGYIDSTYSNGLQRNPSAGSRYTASSMDLHNFFRLSDLSNMTFFYTQSYYDNYGNPFAPINNDTLNTGFIYSLSSGRGYSLYATWATNLQRQNPTGIKTSSQNLNVTMTWTPQQAWAYSLNLNSSDSNTADILKPENNFYRTNDTISATVSYYF